MADNNFRSYRSRDPVVRRRPTRPRAGALAIRSQNWRGSSARAIRSPTAAGTRPTVPSGLTTHRPPASNGARTTTILNSSAQRKSAIVTPPTQRAVAVLGQAPQERALREMSRRPAVDFSGSRRGSTASAKTTRGTFRRLPTPPATKMKRSRFCRRGTIGRRFCLLARPRPSATGVRRARGRGDPGGRGRRSSTVPTTTTTTPQHPPARRSGSRDRGARLGGAWGRRAPSLTAPCSAAQCCRRCRPSSSAGNGPNKIVPGYGDARASNSAQTTVANTGSSEKLVSREEQPVEIQEPSKTAPRVISTIPIAPNPNSLPPGASSIGTAPLAPVPAGAAPAAASRLVIATVPAAPPPAPAPASAEPKKIHTVTIRSDQSGGTDAGAAAAAPQHNSPRSAKMSAAKPSAAAPAPTGSQPLALAPDSQGDVAATPPAPVPAPSRSRSARRRRHHNPAGGTAAETTTASGGYAVQVSSQRSEADAQAAFRALARQISQPARRARADRAPCRSRRQRVSTTAPWSATFASMEEAAGMCSNLKAAGGTCLGPGKVRSCHA